MVGKVVSKVNSVQASYQKVQKQERTKSFASKQNFQGGLGDLPENLQKDLLKHVDSEIDKKLGTKGKFFQWLADTKGEKQVQIINAAFTTTLAPLMIIFNPLAKNKTKEDKKYLALRQPVSAIIALSGGYAMTSMINHFMDTMYNEGYAKTLDLRMQPNESYTYRSFKDAFKDAQKKGQEKEFLAKFDKNVDDKIKEKAFKNGKPSKKYIKNCFKTGYLKKVQEERIQLFTNLLLEKETKNIKLDASDNIILRNKNLQEGHLVKIPNITSETDFRKYIDEKNLHNIKFRDFLAERLKFEFYKDGKEVGNLKPEVTKERLRNIKALDFLIEIGLIKEGQITEKDLKVRLLNGKYNKQIKGEIFSSPNILKENGESKLQEYIAKYTSRLTEMTVGQDIVDAKTISLEHFMHQLKFDLENGSLQELMNMNMHDALDKLNKTILKGDLAGYSPNTDLKTIAQNLIETTAKRVSKNAETHKFYIGIVFNLFTTAVTCTILNWAYPRFVDTFFPHLSNKKKLISPVQVKKQEGGNK